MAFAGKIIDEEVSTKEMVLKREKYRGGKMDSKPWSAIHVGYAPGDAYRAYVPEMKRVLVTKDVTFIEKLIRTDTESVKDADIDHEPVKDQVESDEECTDRTDQSARGKKWMPWETDEVSGNRGEDDASLAFMTAETIMGGTGRYEPLSVQHEITMND